jgi:hypothetical protein
MGVGICKTEILCAVRFIPLWTLIILLFLFKLLGNLLQRTTMASATRLSRRTLGALVAVSAGAIAVVGTGKIDYRSVRSLLQSTLTGPGSTSRIVAILVVLANFKNFPLVWHVGDLTIIPTFPQSLL